MHPNCSILAQKTKAFTLVELIIAVTLSSIVFLSILIFVSSSISQSVSQEKILQNLTNASDFHTTLEHTLARSKAVIWSGSTTSGTGILLRLDENSTPFALIETRSLTGICASYGESAQASGSGISLAIKMYTAPTSHLSWSGYTIDPERHSVFQGTARIIGTGIAGSTLTLSGTTTELSHPNALMGSGNTLFIADTLNHRILSYDIASKRIAELLGKKDGISLPVDLSLSGSTLLIANAGNGNIFRYADGASDPTYFSGSIRPEKTISFDTIRIGADENMPLTGSSNSGAYTFSGFTKSTNDTITTSPLSYTFSGTQSIMASTKYDIQIQNLSWAPQNPGSHILKLTFEQEGVVVYTSYLPWYTTWDGDITTRTGNILSVIAEWLPFPHNISSAWENGVNPANLMSQTPTETHTLDTTIEDYRINETNRVLTLQWKEYRYYDCRNEKHIIRDMIYKQFLH